jgi:hypothetical protein
MGRIIERFPHVDMAAVHHFFDQDETFRDLCEEYGVCSDAEERLGSAGAGQAHMRREYAALRLRLESEILRYLDEHPTT